MDQTKGGPQLMSIVQGGVGDLHRLSDGGIQTAKLYLKVGTGNSLQKGRGKYRQAGTKNREDEVQRGMYMKNLTM